MKHSILVFLVSMIPVAELRLSIPLGIVTYELPVWQVFFISILGNTFIAFILLHFLERFSLVRKLLHFFCELSKKRHSKKFEIYRNLALVILVAIPLPFTGAWTASLCAFIFNIPKYLAISLIFAGLLISGSIVTLITLGIINI